MITNFDYLKNDPKFSSFASVAISAEKIILMIRRRVFSTAARQWSLQ